MSLRHVVSIFLLVLFFGGCLAKPPVANQEVITTRVGDFSIELKFVNRDLLIERHGSNQYYKQNPFVDYPGKIPPRYIIVFDTRLKTEESTVLLKLKDIRLSIEGEGGTAKDFLYLKNLWRAYAESDGRAWPKIERATRDYMLPDEIAVFPGALMEGYLVFPNPYPKEGGRGVLTMIAETSDGDRGTIDIPIRFSKYSAEPDLPTEDNTGIFAENGS